MNQPPSEPYKSEIVMQTVKCVQCKREFEAHVLVVNGARLAKKACDPCVFALDAAEGLDRDADRRMYYIRNNWCDAATFVDTFDASDPAKEKPAYTWARQWTPRDGNVYVYGPKGTGKTYLARCLLNHAFTQGLSIAEMNAIEFISLIDETKRKNIRHLQHPHVLLFDDVDKAAWNVFTFQHFYALLDYRAKRKYVTLMTANSELRKFIDEYIEKKYINNKALLHAAFDRMNPVTVIEMTGLSLRKKPENVVLLREWNEETEDALI